MIQKLTILIASLAAALKPIEAAAPYNSPSPGALMLTLGAPLITTVIAADPSKPPLSVTDAVMA